MSIDITYNSLSLESRHHTLALKMSQTRENFLVKPKIFMTGGFSVELSQSSRQGAENGENPNEKFRASKPR